MSEKGVIATGHNVCHALTLSLPSWGRCKWTQTGHSDEAIVDLMREIEESKRDVQVIMEGQGQTIVIKYFLSLP